MSNEYQKVTDSLLKSLEFPLRADFFLTDGSFVNSTVHFPEQIDEKVVAMRVVEISFKEKLALELSKETPTSYGTAMTIIDYLEAGGYLKVDGQPFKDWLDEKLDSLNINYGPTRKSIRNWFEDPEKCREAPALKANEILAVKQVPGGRVVVSPAGHTLAYSMAKRIYMEMQGKVLENPVPVHVAAREYYGGRVGRMGHFLVSHQYSGVRIGCQKIPRQAILDLAEREGWN